MTISSPNRCSWHWYRVYKRAVRRRDLLLHDETHRENLTLLASCREAILAIGLKMNYSPRLRGSTPIKLGLTLIPTISISRANEYKVQYSSLSASCFFFPQATLDLASENLSPLTYRCLRYFQRKKSYPHLLSVERCISRPLSCPTRPFSCFSSSSPPSCHA